MRATRITAALAAAAAITLAAVGCGGYSYPPGSGPSCQLQCAPSPAPPPAAGSIILDSSCDPATDTQQRTDTQGQTVQCDSGLAQDPSDNGPTWETP